MRTRILAYLLMGVGALPALALGTTSPACEQTCLNGYVDRYLDAMQAHVAGPDLFASGTKFTENGIRLPLGNEGLWFRMSGRGTYKFYIPDVETQQVAFIGTLREGGSSTSEATKVTIALRLKIARNRISEVEQLVIRPDNTGTVGGGAAAPSRFPPTAEAIEKLGAPNPVFAEVIPTNKRPSREEMIKTASYYFAGLQRNDGKGYYPFSDDCDRIENGMQTTHFPQRDPATGATVSLGCKEQFEKTLKNIVSRIRDRRFVAVDREHGIVFAFAFFDHANINWTWQLAELFKVQDGRIRRIEAAFHRAPYGINSGWSTYEQGMSEEPRIIR